MCFVAKDVQEKKDFSCYMRVHMYVDGKNISYKVYNTIVHMFTGMHRYVCLYAYI